MIDFEYKSNYDVGDLRRIVKILRGEGGCPWDREQTHESIRREFIEEVYEVVEAIDERSSGHLREELGDVLLQVVFHADIEEDAGHFDLDAVADEVCRKLILRHPHVFGDTAVSGSAEVLQNWDKIKKAEKHRDTLAADLDSVAKSLPALWRAEKIQKKAAKAGLDRDSMEGVLNKIDEETVRLRRALANGGDAAQTLGELLFACVNASRRLKLDPETVLRSACDRYVERISAMETLAARRGGSLESMGPADLDKLRDEVEAGRGSV